jgi:molybdopterin-guanine dinucleotide biosynthesis protein A
MGQPKALLPIPPDNTPLLLHILRRLQPLATGQVVVIANDPTIPLQAGLPPEVQVLSDLYPDVGTLGGIGTGLSVCPDWAMFVACDMPLLNPQLFRWLQTLAREQDETDRDCWDAIVPIVEGYAEPLHALYHRRCLPFLEARLANGERRATSFLPDVRVRSVQEEELRQIDPALRSFFNANTPAEWEAALNMMRGNGFSQP